MLAYLILIFLKAGSYSRFKHSVSIYFFLQKEIDLHSEPSPDSGANISHIFEIP